MALTVAGKRVERSSDTYRRSQFKKQRRDAPVKSEEGGRIVYRDPETGRITSTKLPEAQEVAARQTAEINKRKETQTRSTGVNPGGVQQIPGLQTQTTRPPQEVSSQEQELRPVGTSRSGDIIYSDRQARTYVPVASSEEGTILSEESRTIKRSAQPFESKRGEGFATPGVFISSERRRDIVEFGERLVEDSEPGVIGNLGVPRSQFGSSLRKIVGGNLVAFGGNPQGYTAENVVLPSTTGAVFGAGATKVLSRVPVVGEAAGLSTRAAARLGLAAEAVVVTGGATTLLSEVASRSPEEQRPDVIFAGKGAIAGSRPTSPTTQVKGITELYGGTPVRSNRATRLNLRTAGKPTSKVELRKQSFNQAYNPNIYRGKDFVIERTPRQFKSVEVLQGTKVRATEGRILRTGEGTYVAARTAYAGQGRINEPNRIVDFIPKGSNERARVQFGYDTKQKVNTGNVKNIPYNSQEGKDYQRPSSQVSGGKTFTETVLEQNIRVQKISKNPGRESFVPDTPVKKYIGTPLASGGGNNVVVSQRVPEFELTPNAPSLRGGFRVRKSGEKVFDASRLKNDLSGRKRNTELVVVDNNYFVQKTPSKPIGSVERDLSKELVPVTRGESSFSYGKSSVDLSAGKVSFPTVGEINKPKTIYFDITKRKAEEEQKRLLSLKSFSAQEFSFESTSSFAQDKSQGVYSEPVVDVASTPLFEQDVYQEQGVSQRQRTRQRTTTTPTPITFITPTNKIIEQPFIETKTPEQNFNFRKTNIGLTRPPETPKLVFPGSRGRLLRESEFLVEVGKPGNKYYFNLGVGGKDLVERGATLARNTAAASIKVTPVVSSRGFDVRSIVPRGFDLNKEGRFIQSVPTRISSSGEKQQIPGESVRKRLSKNSEYGKSLSLINKGVPLRVVRFGIKRGFL